MSISKKIDYTEYYTDDYLTAEKVNEIQQCIQADEAAIEEVEKKIEETTSYSKDEIDSKLDKKVNKVDGKDLSTNDYTNDEKAEVAKVKDKQDKLIFDDVPTEDSANSMTSGGIYKTVNGLAESFNEVIETKADKVTTLEGYGIEDAYTKSEIDEKMDSKSTIGKSGEGDSSEIFNDYENGQATGDFSHAEGCYPSAKGTASHAEGNITLANGDYSHSEGYSTLTIGSSTHAEGNQAVAGYYAYMIKSVTYNAENNTSDLVLHTIGILSTGEYCSIRTSTAVDNVLIEKIDESTKTITVNAKIDDLSTKSDENYLIYLSKNDRTGGFNEGGFPIGEGAHAEGTKSHAYGPWSHAEGNSTLAAGQYSHAEGRETLAGYASHAEGRSTEASGNMSHAEGSGSKASGRISHAEGNLTTASGTHSHTEGSGTIASGEDSHAQGAQTEASGYASHAEGEVNKAIGRGAHAEGNLTEAKGDYSHVEGSSTITEGDSAHAEGRGTKATSSNAHAEGFGSSATATNAHAEGTSTEASGESTHAEGNSSKATGNTTHAEGFSTEASGMYTHTEGHLTKASGYASHAEGSRTEVTGAYSHVEGLGNVSNKDYQHIQGRYAEIDSEGKYSHIVGAGTPDTGIRKNIHTVDWDGDGWFSGDIKVGGTSYDDENAKEIATQEYVDGSLDTKVDKATGYGLAKVSIGEPGDNVGNKYKINITGDTKNYLFYDVDLTDDLLDKKANKATTLVGYGIVDAYTKEEIDTKIVGVYRICGSKTVAEINALETSTLTVGNVYNISDSGVVNTDINVNAGDNIVWTENGWDNLSGIVDLSNYVKTTDVATADKAGIVKVSADGGITFANDGYLAVISANSNQILNRQSSTRVITPSILNTAVKAALSDEKRISDMTDEEKTNAREVIGAVSQADIDTKQDTLTFDEEPTENSENPVKSKGIFVAINNLITDITSKLSKKVDVVEGKQLSTNDYTDEDKAEVAKIKDKQDTLVFDETPTKDSTNVITSGAVAKALEGSGGASLAISGEGANSVVINNADTNTNSVKGAGSISIGNANTILSSNARAFGGNIWIGQAGYLVMGRKSNNVFYLTDVSAFSTGTMVLVYTYFTQGGFFNSPTVDEVTAVDTTNKTITLKNTTTLTAQKDYICKCGEKKDGDQIFGGKNATAEGNNTFVSGNAAHAEGSETAAYGYYSHAEGTGTKAFGMGTHAEGTNTKAYGNYSHAEGQRTITNGNCSHAEGTTTTASGSCSHAEGISSVAGGDFSHAQNQSTIANGNSQTAIGKFNIADTTNLFIIGKGTADSARANALIVNQDGGLWVSGNIKTGGNSYDDENAMVVMTKTDYNELKTLIDQLTQRVVALESK